MSDYNDPNENRLIRSLNSGVFSDATKSIVDTHSIVKVLAIAVTADLAAFAMLYVANEQVVQLIDENGTDVLFYEGAFFFFAGFFIGFAIYRFLANKWPHRGIGIFIWLAAIVAGVGNVLLALLVFASQPR